MKRVYKVALILLIPLLLSSCSSPTVSKPSFDSYGQETTKNDFMGKYQARYSEFVTDYSARYQGKSFSAKISLMISEESYYKSKTDSLKDKNYFTQVDSYYHIDNFNQRIMSSTSMKTYMDGAYAEDSGRERVIESDNFYGEVLGNYFFYVDLDDKTVKQQSSSYFDVYSSNAVSEFLGDPIWPSIISSTEKATYYVNNTRFTCVVSDSNGVEDVMQVEIKDGISIRYKKSSIEANYQGITTTNDYASLKLTISSEQISKLDYFDYTFI